MLTTTTDEADLVVDGVRRRYRVARAGHTAYVSWASGSLVLEVVPRFPDARDALVPDLRHQRGPRRAGRAVGGSPPWLVPPRVAMELLLTGAPISARRALEVGLVNAVVAPGELHSHTRALVATIAADAPLSVRAGKAMVYAAAEHGRSAAFEVAEGIWRPVHLSRDAQEGPRAFSEKRSPRWEAR